MEVQRDGVSEDVAMSRIAVIGGAGYVGASYAAVLAELGHEVIGLDLDARKVGMLSRGEPPIHEPGLGELLERGLSAGRLRFTTEYADAAPDAEFAFPFESSHRTSLGQLA